MNASPATTHAPLHVAVDWRSLLTAAQSGDAAASETIACLLGPRLRGFLRRSGAPPEELDDLAIEALEKVFQHLANIRNGDLLPWAFQVARNHLRDFYGRRALPTQSAEATEEQAALPRGRRPATSQLVLAVRAWIRDLSAEDRHLIEGRAAGVPYEQLAAELGLASAAARQRLSRLLKRLEVRLRTDPTLASELVRRLC